MKMRRKTASPARPAMDRLLGSRVWEGSRGLFWALRFAVTAMVLGALVLSIATRPALAQTGNRQLDLMRLYQTDLRALAMGNAYGPIARGEGALLYNPAGLAQFKFDLKIDGGLAVEGEAGDFFTDTYDLIDSATSSEISSYLSKYLGTTQNYRTQTYVNGVANLGLFNFGFGGGVIDQTRYNFEFRDVNNDGISDTTDLYVQSTTVLEMTIVGIAFALFDGQMLMGVNYKDFTYKEEIGSATFGALASSGSIELDTTGSTYEGSGFDVGILWRMETFPALRGQYSFTAYNIGGITLTPTVGAGETLEVPATYNFGVAFSPEFAFFHVLFSAEMEDITDAAKVRDANGNDYGRTQKQRLHAGLEVGLFETATGNNVLNARVGLHRGFLSWGAELNLFSGMRLLYTKYKENFGSVSAQDLHDFVAFQLSFGLAF
ncbi:MAG: hypothetical protein IIC64_01970 [SAR324 cluster bacterium]|nr:hypothetical protein [SAR324 cluster bacterium]